MQLLYRLLSLSYTLSFFHLSQHYNHPCYLLCHMYSFTNINQFFITLLNYSVKLTHTSSPPLPPHLVNWIERCVVQRAAIRVENLKMEIGQELCNFNKGSCTTPVQFLFLNFHLWLRSCAPHICPFISWGVGMGGGVCEYEAVCRN